LKRTAVLLLLFGGALLAVACAGEETTTTAPTPPSGESDSTEPAASNSQPAVAEGIVFEDLNDNGQYDDGEPGLAALSIVALAPDGRRLVIATDRYGYYRFEAPFIQHRISVNTSFFPNSFLLTTDKEFYDTSVLAGETRSELNFGYRDRENSSIIGTVYDDLNNNGLQDEGEPGLAGVTVLAIAHDQELLDARDVTGSDGRYRIELTDIDHQVMVDAATLPAGYLLSSARDVFPIFVPPGFVASDINFGYRAGIG
jgi:hypothetical protein